MSAPRGLFVGLATLDVIHRVDQMPGSDEKGVATATWVAAGGPATVAAIAFAALGGRATLWTALGSGPIADALRADLADAGVEVRDAAPSGYQAPVSTVLVEVADGRRSVVSGSAQRPVLDRVEPVEQAGGQVLLIDGHLPELARAAVAEARSAGIPVVADAGSAKPVFAELLGSITDLLCSAGYRHADGSVPSALAGGGPRLVAVSHGAAPVQWWTPSQTGELAVPEVSAVDTLGAGDVWHGSYCHALASGLQRTDALRFANRQAAKRVSLLGPFAWRAALG